MKTESHKEIGALVKAPEREPPCCLHHVRKQRDEVLVEIKSPHWTQNLSDLIVDKAFSPVRKQFLWHINNSVYGVIGDNIPNVIG